MLHHNRANILYKILLATAYVLSVFAIGWGGVSASHQDVLTQNKHSKADEKAKNQVNAVELHQTKKQRSTNDPKSLKDQNKEANSSDQNNKKLAVSLLEETLAGAKLVEPIECSLLTQVEAATLLWQFDRQRAWDILKDSVETLSNLIEAEKGEKKTQKSLDKKQQRLRFKIFLRIAKLDPGLINQLASKDQNDGKMQKSISGEWTEEARAVMLVATEQVNKDPELAVRTAEQSLSLGFVAWESFLHHLVIVDRSRSVQLASRLLRQLRDSSIPAVRLLNLNSFVFGGGRSQELTDEFFLSLATRLQRDLRPDIAADDLVKSFQTAYSAQRLASYFPQWQTEFDNIVSAYQTLFKDRSMPAPNPPRAVTIDSSTLTGIATGNTEEVQEKLQQVKLIANSPKRDEEYRKLAINAALREDSSLAESLLSKIENQRIRQETNFKVYSTLVRKELNSQNWAQARTYCFKITDPLARTVIVNLIGKSMSRFRENKSGVSDLYSEALAQLYREVASESLAKAYLILAKSLSSGDVKASVEAINSAIFVMNKLSVENLLLGESNYSDFGPYLELLPTVMPEEALDLTEIIGPLFNEMARRDPEDAQITAYGITHSGLRSLALLGIVRGLLEAPEKPKTIPKERPKAKKLSQNS